MLPDTFLLWLGLAMCGLITVGYLFSLAPRNGPTPISEIVILSCFGAVIGWYFVHPATLIPIAFTTYTMISKRGN